MVVHVIVDAVAPRIAPAVARKQILEYGGRVEFLGQLHRAAVDDERPSRMIGNQPLVLEAEHRRLALAQEARQLILGGPRPSRRALGSPLDIFQYGHRFTPRPWAVRPRRRRVDPCAGSSRGSRPSRARTRAPCPPSVSPA